MFVLPNTTEFTLGTYVVRDMRADPQCMPIGIHKTYSNGPINLTLVESFEKGERPNCKVPDAGLYTIEFAFPHSGRMWYFQTKEERDTEYELLVKENLKNG